MKLFSERLKDLRIKKDLTLNKLAKEVNICKSTLSYYERGEREPSIKHVKTLADYFNVNFEWLCGFK